MTNPYTTEIHYITHPDGRTVPTNVREDIRDARRRGLPVSLVDPRDGPKATDVWHFSRTTYAQDPGTFRSDLFRFATESVFDVMRDDPDATLTPQGINQGYCPLWADFVITYLPGSAEFVCPEHMTHVAVYHLGRYYDAECPEGVDDFHDLPIQQRA